MSEEIGHEFIVIAYYLYMPIIPTISSVIKIAYYIYLLLVFRAYLARQLDRGLALGKANEFGGDDTTLMNELIETVLAIGTWFTEIEFTCAVR